MEELTAGEIQSFSSLRPDRNNEASSSCRLCETDSGSTRSMVHHVVGAADKVPDQDQVSQSIIMDTFLHRISMLFGGRNYAALEASGVNTNQQKVDCFLWHNSNLVVIEGNPGDAGKPLSKLEPPTPTILATLDTAFATETARLSPANYICALQILNTDSNLLAYQGFSEGGEGGLLSSGNVGGISTELVI
ncbi:hypothetical protein B0H17DRAFT_1126658 [Mycena rosella]|uniref:Uncharacterized protein n=1 Tax=Mycena rosella TaxID=1033263 RepID=A0AAD7M7R2_MYCRO|nr:hypothetical protein B0H17DRAFT_1126658 [Mycena rosella]